MNDQWAQLLELLSRLRHVRFSLATCALMVLFLGSVVAAWVNRHPWVMIRSTALPDFRGNEGPHVLPLSQEGKVLVERPRTEYRLTVLDWHTGELEPVEFPETEVALDFSPDGRFLTSDKKGTARLRQIGRQFALTELPNWVHPTALNLRLSADGNWIAGSGPDGAIWIHDIASQKETAIPAPISTAHRVYLEFSGNGRWLQAYFEEDTGKSGAPEKCLGWYLIDCDRHAKVEVPNEIEFQIRSYGSYRCRFAGTSERLFVYVENWRIDDSGFEPSPGELRTWTDTALAFQKGRCISIWSKDLSKQIGAVTMPELHAGPWQLRLSAEGRQLSYGSSLGGEPRTFLWDTVTGQLRYAFPEPLQVEEFLGPNHLLCFVPLKGELQVWYRRRAEETWGVLGLPEVWLALVFLVGTILSIRRDRWMAKVRSG